MGNERCPYNSNPLPGYQGHEWKIIPNAASCHLDKSAFGRSETPVMKKRLILSK